MNEINQGASSQEGNERPVADLGKAVVDLEIEIEDKPDPVILSFSNDTRVIEALRGKLEISPDMQLFERDHDEPLISLPEGRKAVRIVAHRCHQVMVEVRYEHLSKSEKFPPSATVFRVLKWAVSKRGFGLDPMAAAKANLILPGADAPLPREDVIGKYVKPGLCTLVVDLTLKDFTNG